MVAEIILLFVFIHRFFLFCIYIAEEHTRHTSMCFTVAVECVLPLYKKTNTKCHTDTHTDTRRQPGHVAHDKSHTGQSSRPQSNRSLPPPPPLSDPYSFFPPPTLSLLPPDSPSRLSSSHIYTFSYAQLRNLSAFPPKLFSRHVSCWASSLALSLSPLLLSVCLTAVVGFCIALFFFFFFFF